MARPLALKNSERNSDHIITFAPDGTAQCLWTEAVPLHDLGRLEVHRASTVEFDNITQLLASAGWTQIRPSLLQIADRVPGMGTTEPAPRISDCAETLTIGMPPGLSSKRCSVQAAIGDSLIGLPGGDT